MGTKVTKQLFEKVISEEVSKLFAPLGFIEVEGGAFCRQCGEVVHAFGLIQNPSYTNFHVLVGANVPTLTSQLDYINFGGSHYPTLLVSRTLGLLQRDKLGERMYYHFATVEEMREKLPLFYTDFCERAEPLLAGLATVDAVAREFYDWRVGPLSTGELRRPDPFAWAIYGWLLMEAGRGGEASQWIARALDEVARPQFGKAGKLVPAGTKGARLIARSDPELRLREVLENGLAK